MKEKIYIRNAAGELHPSEETEFETEDSLQQLIALHPELLAGDRMRPDDPLRWTLVQREMPIEGWAVDLLLMDQHSCPTLVEVKRGDNREGRRAVVGQMLDYASTAAIAWSGDAMRVAFEQDAVDRGRDPHEELRTLLGYARDADIEMAANAFWERAAANLEAGRLRLLFVSDKISVELERSVTFWNVQTKESIEVLAVEVKQYPGQFGDALVSRVIGQVDATRTKGSGSRSPRLSHDEFLASFRPDVRDAIESLLEAVGRATGTPRDTFQLGSTSLSIRGRCSLWARPLYLGLLWLPNEANGDGSFTFHAEFSPDHDIPPELGSTLENWINQFENDPFGAPYQSGTYIGRQLTADELVTHVDLLSARLCDALTRLAEL